MPACLPSHGPFGSIGFAADPDRAAAPAARAKDRLAEFAAAGPDQPGETDDLAGTHGDRCRAHQRRRVDAFRLEHDVADLSPCRRARKMHVASDHQADQFVGRGLGDLACSGKPAVLEHGHRMAKRENLGETVRNVDHRNAVAGQPPHHIEQFFGFGKGQRRRRLVEDQDPEVARQRLGDLDDLGLCRRKGRHFQRRIDGDAKLRDEHPCPIAHGADIHLTQPLRRLPAGEDVLGNRKLRHQRAFLMHDADAEIAGRLFVELADFGAIDQDAALVARIDAGDDLAEGRLAGAVFAEQRTDFTALDAHRDVVERPHAGEELGKAFDFEPRRHGAIEPWPGGSGPAWPGSSRPWFR